jgi:calcium/calmodulin-dependent protein kinase I
VSKGSYTEAAALELTRKLLEAIEYMHSRGVVHRDLKPENILMCNRCSDTDFKLADFGFAECCTDEDENSAFTAACGTPAYCAPEILHGQRYGKPVDIWSTGVVIFVVLCGYQPFYEEDTQRLFAQIKKGDLEFESPDWDDISEATTALIRDMLEPNPAQRPTAAQLLSRAVLSGCK